MPLLILILLALTSSVSAQEVWSLNTIPLVNPWNYGATANCAADDQAGLTAAIAALPSGGIVYMNPNTCVRKDNLLTVTQSHLALWCEAQDCTIYQRTNGVANHQALLFSQTTGAEIHGIKFTSDAAARVPGDRENAITFDRVSGANVVGVEVAGARAVGIALVGCNGSYVEGSYIHSTYADHVMHTPQGAVAATNSWVWSNFVFNDAPTNGDDAFSCVTFSLTAPRVSNIEFWSNTVLHSGNGRGFSVGAGQDISIHDNRVYGTAAAGVLIDSEPFWNSGNSFNISIANNAVYGAAHSVGHPCYLVAANNYVNAGQSHDITLSGNTGYGCPSGTYGSGPPAGLGANVTNTGMISTEPGGGTPAPGSVVRKSTAILKLRDTSFVASTYRTGLLRIHVRRPVACTAITCFETRYEYLVKGPPGRVDAWAATEAVKGGYLVARTSVSGVSYALVLTPLPTTLGPFAGLSGVSFGELRAGANSGTLAAIWGHVDSGDY